MIVRRLAAFAVVIVTIFGLYRVTVLPLKCNRRESALLRGTRRIANAPPYIASRPARENLAMVAECIRVRPTNAGLYMIAAANYRILGRTDDAVSAYRNALKWDERPELYIELGSTELEAGRQQEGEADIYRGALFNPDMLKDFEPTDVSARIRSRVQKRDEALMRKGER